jgi:rRNA processing protein Krr1/Pno1
MSVIDCAFNGEEKTMNRYLQKKKKATKEREKKEMNTFI